MDSLTVNSPAKINFGLNIISKRDDGYHNIETVFYPLRLSDTITFTKSGKTEFATDSDFLKEDQSGNLIMKALRLLEETAGRQLSVSIFLEKRIPIGAGLGGGSSNAAAALTSLNRLYDLKLAQSRLKELALRLGSDVPFFIDPLPSFAELRGEILTPVKLSLDYALLLVNPGIHVSTAQAYKNSTPSLPDISLNDALEDYIESPGDFKKFVVNDFEASVLKSYPEIAELKEHLYKKGAFFALMSGSGSSVYGLFSDIKKAEEAANELPSAYFKYIEDGTSI